MPSTVDYGTIYTITVSETTSGTQNGNALHATVVACDSSAGTTSGPYNTWSTHGSYNGSGYSTVLTHTFSVANYDLGSYWWRGKGQDSWSPEYDRIWFYSGAIGYWQTNSGGSGG